LFGRKSNLQSANCFFDETALPQQGLEHFVRVVIGLVVVIVIVVAPTWPSGSTRFASRRPGRVGFHPGKVGGAITPRLEPRQPQVLFDLGHKVLYIQRQQLGLFVGGCCCCRRHHVPAGHHVTHTCGKRRVVVRQSIDEAHQIEVKVFRRFGFRNYFLSTDGRER